MTLTLVAVVIVLGTWGSGLCLELAKRDRLIAALKQANDEKDAALKDVLASVSHDAWRRNESFLMQPANVTADAWTLGEIQ